jgi:hypothetical protein
LLFRRGNKVIKGRICPECLNDLDQEYIEEGDDRLCIEPLKCPYCGWELRNGWVEEEVQHPHSSTNNSGVNKKSKC